MILDGWQQEALEWEGDLLLNTGRQVGKTTLLACKSGKYLIDHPKSSIICCSLTEDQAKLIIVMTLDYLQKTNAKLICKGTKKPTQNKIELTNGSWIRARPVGTTGDAVRGFTASVLILDEVARFNELIMESAKPTLMTTGGKIWAASTPHGQIGWFWEMYQNKNKRFKVIEVNSWDVMHNRPLSKDWTEKRRAEAIEFLEQEMKDMTSNQFKQEYMGQFVQALSNLFSAELVRKCMTIPRSSLITSSLSPWDRFLGVDVARWGKDDTVLASFYRIDKEKLRMFDMEIIKKQPITFTTARILEKDKICNYKKIFYDSSGVGGGGYDMLMEEIPNKMIAIENARKSLNKDETQKRRLLKEDLYANLNYLMTQGKIQFFDDPDIYLSLTSLQYETTERGDTKISGNYDHIAEAIVRACWCVKDKSLNIWCR